MQRHGTPTMSLQVWGDWYSVMRAREYRDVLLDQKPFDEDDAAYHQYSVPCSSTKELLKAAATFSDLGLRCAIRMVFKSDDNSVWVTAQTGDGYGQDEAFVHVSVHESEIEAKKVIEKAIALLQGALT